MNSSRDDFIPVLSTGIKCHPGMKRDEKRHVNSLSGMKCSCKCCLFSIPGRSIGNWSKIVSAHAKNHAVFWQPFYHRLSCSTILQSFQGLPKSYVCDEQPGTSIIFALSVLCYVSLLKLLSASVAACTD